MFIIVRRDHVIASEINLIPSDGKLWLLNEKFEVSNQSCVLYIIIGYSIFNRLDCSAILFLKLLIMNIYVSSYANLSLISFRTISLIKASNYFHT